MSQQGRAQLCDQAWTEMLSGRRCLYQRRLDAALHHFSKALEYLNKARHRIGARLLHYSGISELTAPQKRRMFLAYSDWLRLHTAFVALLNDRGLVFKALGCYGHALRNLTLALSVTKESGRKFGIDDHGSDPEIQSMYNPDESLRASQVDLIDSAASNTHSCFSMLACARQVGKADEAVFLSHSMNECVIHINLGDLELYYMRHESAMLHFQEAASKLKALQYSLDGFKGETKAKVAYLRGLKMDAGFLCDVDAAIQARRARVFCVLGRWGTQVDEDRESYRGLALSNALQELLVQESATSCLHRAHQQLAAPHGARVDSEAMLAEAVPELTEYLDYKDSWLSGLFPSTTPTSELSFSFHDHSMDLLCAAEIAAEIALLHTKRQMSGAMCLCASLGLSAPVLNTFAALGGQHQPQGVQQHKEAVKQARRSFIEAADHLAAYKDRYPYAQAMYSKAANWAKQLRHMQAGGAEALRSACLPGSLEAVREHIDVLSLPTHALLAAAAAKGCKFGVQMAEFKFESIKSPAQLAEHLGCVHQGAVLALPPSWWQCEQTQLKAACLVVYDSLQAVLAAGSTDHLESVAPFLCSGIEVSAEVAKTRQLLCTLQGMSWMHDILLELAELEAAEFTGGSKGAWEECATLVERQLAAPILGFGLLSEAAAAAPENSRVHILRHSLHLVMEERVGNQFSVAPQTLRHVVGELYELLPLELLTELTLQHGTAVVPASVVAALQGMLPGLPQAAQKLILCYPLQVLAATGKDVLVPRNGVLSQHRLYLSEAEMQTHHRLSRLVQERDRLRSLVSTSKHDLDPTVGQDLERLEREIVQSNDHSFAHLWDLCCGQYLRRNVCLDAAVGQIERSRAVSRRHAALRAFCYNGVVGTGSADEAEDLLIQGSMLAVLFKKHCHYLHQDLLNAATAIQGRLLKISSHEYENHQWAEHFVQSSALLLQESLSLQGGPMERLCQLQAMVFDQHPELCSRTPELKSWTSQFCCLQLSQLTGSKFSEQKTRQWGEWLFEYWHNIEFDVTGPQKINALFGTHAEMSVGAPQEHRQDSTELGQEFSYRASDGRATKRSDLEGKFNTSHMWVNDLHRRKLEIDLQVRSELSAMGDAHAAPTQCSDKALLAALGSVLASAPDMAAELLPTGENKKTILTADLLERLQELLWRDVSSMPREHKKKKELFSLFCDPRQRMLNSNSCVLKLLVRVDRSNPALERVQSQSGDRPHVPGTVPGLQISFPRLARSGRQVPELFDVVHLERRGQPTQGAGQLEEWYAYIRVPCPDGDSTVLAQFWEPGVELDRRPVVTAMNSGSFVELVSYNDPSDKDKDTVPEDEHPDGGTVTQVLVWTGATEWQRTGPVPAIGATGWSLADSMADQRDRLLEWRDGTVSAVVHGSDAPSQVKVKDIVRTNPVHFVLGKHSSNWMLNEYEQCNNCAQHRRVTQAMGTVDGGYSCENGFVDCYDHEHSEVDCSSPEEDIDFFLDPDLTGFRPLRAELLEYMHALDRSDPAGVGITQLGLHCSVVHDLSDPAQKQLARAVHELIGQGGGQLSCAVLVLAQAAALGMTQCIHEEKWVQKEVKIVSAAMEEQTEELLSSLNNRKKPSSLYWTLQRGQERHVDQEVLMSKIAIQWASTCEAAVSSAQLYTRFLDMCRTVAKVTLLTCFTTAVKAPVQFSALEAVIGEPFPECFHRDVSQAQQSEHQPSVEHTDAAWVASYPRLAALLDEATAFFGRFGPRVFVLAEQSRLQEPLVLAELISRQVHTIASERVAKTCARSRFQAGLYAAVATSAIVVKSGQLSGFPETLGHRLRKLEIDILGEDVLMEQLQLSYHGRVQALEEATATLEGSSSNQVVLNTAGKRDSEEVVMATSSKLEDPDAKEPTLLQRILDLEDKLQAARPEEVAWSDMQEQEHVLKHFSMCETLSSACFNGGANLVLTAAVSSCVDVIAQYRANLLDVKKEVLQSKHEVSGSSRFEHLFKYRYARISRSRRSHQGAFKRDPADESVQVANTLFPELRQQINHWLEDMENFSLAPPKEVKIEAVWWRVLEHEHGVLYRALLSAAERTHELCAVVCSAAQRALRLDLVGEQLIGTSDKHSLAPGYGIRHVVGKNKIMDTKSTNQTAAMVRAAITSKLPPMYTFQALLHAGVDQIDYDLRMHMAKDPHHQMLAPDMGFLEQVTALLQQMAHASAHDPSSHSHGQATAFFDELANSADEMIPQVAELCSQILWSEHKLISLSKQQAKSHQSELMQQLTASQLDRHYITLAGLQQQRVALLGQFVQRVLLPMYQNSQALIEHCLHELDDALLLNEQDALIGARSLEERSEIRQDLLHKMQLAGFCELQTQSTDQAGDVNWPGMFESLFPRWCRTGDAELESTNAFCCNFEEELLMMEPMLREKRVRGERSPFVTTEDEELLPWLLSERARAQCSYSDEQGLLHFYPILPSSVHAVNGMSDKLHALTQLSCSSGRTHWERLIADMGKAEHYQDVSWGEYELGPEALAQGRWQTAKYHSRKRIGDGLQLLGPREGLLLGLWEFENSLKHPNAAELKLELAQHHKVLAVISLQLDASRGWEHTVPGTAHSKSAAHVQQAGKTLEVGGSVAL
eukprot:TRINITY_DN4979_c0_g1_i3.p1 TRINITY_DN4979_c0_g1~~TRINITY_DN4979_c0_g1_i3.p1  ORF type:complete len:2597 (-),score=794.42 TRINITY_DN4979_c0_g1_i3:298-8088(-)